MNDCFEDVTLFKMNPSLLAERGVEKRVLLSGKVDPVDDVDDDLFDLRRALTTPGAQPPRFGYTRPRNERHALQKLCTIQHAIAAKRVHVLEELGIKLLPAELSAKKRMDDDMSDEEPPPQPQCPAYFNSRHIGSVAVRTQVGPKGEAPPIPTGDTFLRATGEHLHELPMKGPGAPVIVHFANCRFDAWLKKHEAHLRDELCDQGLGRTDMAAKQLDLKDRHGLDRFYRTFIQGDMFDEVAYMAQFGLVLRIPSVRTRLADARRKLRQQLSDEAREQRDAQRAALRAKREPPKKGGRPMKSRW